MAHSIKCNRLASSDPMSTDGSQPRKWSEVPKFFEGKELLLINMADTREIEHNLVPNTKGKSNMCNQTNLRKRKTYGQIDADIAVYNQCRWHTCGRHVKHVKANEAPPSLTVARITCGERTGGRLTCPHQSVWKYRYWHKIPIRVPVRCCCWFFFYCCCCFFGGLYWYTTLATLRLQMTHIIIMKRSCQAKVANCDLRSTDDPYNYYEKGWQAKVTICDLRSTDNPYNYYFKKRLARQSGKL